MKPYVLDKETKGVVTVINGPRLPTKFRKMEAEWKRETRRKRRKKDKGQLKEEWRDVLY